MEAYVGEIRMIASDFAPQGWVFCDGGLLSVDDFEHLYSLLGNIYGGTPTQTFAVPDMRGRIPIGTGQGPGTSRRQLGDKGGEATVKLTVENLATHAHNLMGTTTIANASVAGPGSALASTPNNIMAYNDATLATGAIEPFAAQAIGPNRSANDAHENVMPSVCVNFIIATEGVFPTLLSARQKKA